LKPHQFLCNKTQDFDEFKSLLKVPFPKRDAHYRECFFKVKNFYDLFQFKSLCFFITMKIYDYVIDLQCFYFKSNIKLINIFYYSTFLLHKIKLVYRLIGGFRFLHIIFICKAIAKTKFV